MDRNAVRCDAMRRRLGGRADRGACAHAYRAETGSLGDVILEPPADWQPGRAGQDQCLELSLATVGPCQPGAPEAVPHGSDLSCSRCEPHVFNAKVDSRILDLEMGKIHLVEQFVNTCYPIDIYA